MVGLQYPSRPEWEVQDDLDELAELVLSAGAIPVGRVVQKRARADPATLIGRGKAAELRALAEAPFDLVVFDDELSPGQQRNLEEAVDGPVIDRTELILDIFAQRARTREGKLQVELAQLRYRLPRLAGSVRHLSRLGGGIATRGPGETKLETDRRRIRRRIVDLEAQTDLIGQRRGRQRSARQRVPYPLVTLVGYTNAGKSTLLNALTGSDVVSHDQLFATLDPTTRVLRLPSHLPVLVTDTVGFIRKLPTQLVAAFRATLEEVGEADLLLHVVDASSPRREAMQAVVVKVLSDLGAGDKPVITALNKADLVEAPSLDRAQRQAERGVVVSARTGRGLGSLREEIDAWLREARPLLRLHLPYSEAALHARAHAQGEVSSEISGEAGWEMEGHFPPAVAGVLERFRV